MKWGFIFLSYSKHFAMLYISVLFTFLKFIPSHKYFLFHVKCLCFSFFDCFLFLHSIDTGVIYLKYSLQPLAKMWNFKEQVKISLKYKL